MKEVLFVGRNLLHITQTEIRSRKFSKGTATDIHRSDRIKYITSEISETKFKHTIYNNEKLFNCFNDNQQVLTMFITVILLFPPYKRQN